MGAAEAICKEDCSLARSMQVTHVRLCMRRPQLAPVASKISHLEPPRSLCVGQEIHPSPHNRARTPWSPKLIPYTFCALLLLQPLGFKLLRNPTPGHRGSGVIATLISTNEHRSSYKCNSARVTVMSLIPYQSFTQWMLLGDSQGLKSHH